MSNKPRRPWFQLHLSTAIVLMFVAGGFLWLSLSGHTSNQWQMFEQEGGGMHVAAHGFPFDAYSEAVAETSAQPILSVWNPIYVVLDTIFALIVVVVIGVIVEYCLRRQREARKP